MVNTFDNFEPKNVQNRLKLRKVMQSMSWLKTKHEKVYCLRLRLIISNFVEWGIKDILGYAHSMKAKNEISFKN